MNIGGFMKQSFIDFPETLSAVLFTNGCNLNCWYCHNHTLISGEESPPISFEKVIDFLKSRAGFLEGVVITGGEPTLQPDLEEIIDKIRALGYKIKLDTNGTNPEVLERLVNSGKLDYVAMDIKNSFQKYHKTTCFLGNVELLQEKIKKSIAILMQKKVDFEFRTTFSPDITLEDIKEIALITEGAPRFFLQKYNPVNDKTLTIPHSLSTFEKALEIVKEKVPFSKIRGF